MTVRRTIGEREMGEFWLAFVPMFVAVDPVGMIPVFIGLTSGMDRAKRRRVIMLSVATAMLVALGFLAVGKVLLKLLGVTIPDFLIAGGALLFVLALAELLSSDKTAREMSAPDETLGAVPIGVPLIVGPAVLAASLVLVDRYGILATVAAIAANILLAGVILHWSDAIARLLGNAGTRVISKLAALLLAAFAVMFIRNGVTEIITQWARAWH